MVGAIWSGKSALSTARAAARSWPSEVQRFCASIRCQSSGSVTATTSTIPAPAVRRLAAVGSPATLAARRVTGRGALAGCRVMSNLGRMGAPPGPRAMGKSLRPALTCTVPQRPGVPRHGRQRHQKHHDPHGQASLRRHGQAGEGDHPKADDQPQPRPLEPLCHAFPLAPTFTSRGHRRKHQPRSRQGPGRISGPATTVGRAPFLVPIPLAEFTPPA